jgi:hypothetical protein
MSAPDSATKAAARTADWIRRHQFIVYIVLGLIAWYIVWRNYPLESLTPVYANF